MSILRPSVAVLAVALLLAGCGSGTEPEAADLDDALDASASPLAEESSTSEESTSDEEPAPTPSAEESDADEDEDPDTGDEDSSDDEGDADADDADVDADDEGKEDGEVAAGASAACTLTESDAGIEVLAPADGESVDSTIDLSLCGNTFEAGFEWEFVADDGSDGGSGFGTMTCGNGCVGTYDDEITVEATGPGTLRVFETDAATGDAVNVVEVGLTVTG